MIDLPNIVSEGILDVDAVESTADNYAKYPWLKYLKDIIDGKPAGDKVDKILTDIRTSLNPYSTNYGRACRLHKQNLNGCQVQLVKLNGVWKLVVSRNDLRYPRIIKFLIGRTLADVQANQAAPGYFKSLSRQSYENGIYFPPIELFNIIKSMLPSEYQRVVECDGCATPANTMGMGNPMTPECDAVGSGDIPNAGNPKRKKKMKKLKDVLEGILDADSISDPLQDVYKTFGLIEDLLKCKSKHKLDQLLQQIMKTTQHLALKNPSQEFLGGDLCRLIVRQDHAMYDDGIALVRIIGDMVHVLTIAWKDKIYIKTSTNKVTPSHSQATYDPYPYLPSELFDLVKNKLKIK